MRAEQSRHLVGLLVAGAATLALLVARLDVEPTAPPESAESATLEVQRVLREHPERLKCVCIPKACLENPLAKGCS